MQKYSRDPSSKPAWRTLPQSVRFNLLNVLTLHTSNAQVGAKKFFPFYAKLLAAYLSVAVGIVLISELDYA